MVIGGAYLLWKLPYGWIPHDEGLLAESANRVLNGELPHRDFQDAYTGGLSYMHAASLAMFGNSLYSMRICLFVAALLTIPAWYLIAERIVSPVAASLVTLVSLSWSFPNYLAALPTWYTLAFASWTFLAILRYGDSQSSRWLLVAGLTCGVSICFKIVGLYALAAVLLCVVYHQLSDDKTDHNGKEKHSGVQWALAVIGIALIGLVMLVLRSHLGFAELIVFVLPIAITSALLLLAGQSRSFTFSNLVNRCFKPLLIVVTCAAIPIAILLVPYIASNSLSDFVHGVLVLPQQRFDYADMDLPPLIYMLGCIPALICFHLSSIRSSNHDTSVSISLGIAGAVLFLVTFYLFPETTLADGVYRWTFHAIRMIVPALSVLIAVRLKSQVRDASQRYHLFAGCAMISLMSLVQFPYSFGIYFCYIAPLVLLTATVILQPVSAPKETLCPNRTWFVTQMILLVFGVIWLNTSFIRGFGARHIQIPKSEYVTNTDNPRFGLTVLKDDIKEYEFVRTLIHSLAHENYGVLAIPDCPEVYYLSGVSNPTSAMYDFFNTAALNPTEIEDYYIALLDKHKPAVVVINNLPEFSNTVPALIERILSSRFSKSAQSPSPQPKFTVYFQDPGF